MEFDEEGRIVVREEEETAGKDENEEKETLEAVLSVFIDAYNKFGEAKEKYKIPVEHRTTNTKHLHKYRERPFSVLDFL